MPTVSSLSGASVNSGDTIGTVLSHNAKMAITGGESMVNSSTKIGKTQTIQASSVPRDARKASPSSFK